MKSSAAKIKLNNFDELFGYNTNTDDTDKVVELSLDKLISFKNHPFKVNDDEKMNELVDSINENGVLVPGIVRKINDNQYEIISGHRRKHACELVGKETMPVIIKDLSDDESTVIMVDANIQRETVLPSEKAKAYSMKYEAMKHQGIKGTGNTLEAVGEMTGDSAKTVQRYIQLARLIDGLMDMIDTKRLGFIQGVELSLLDKQQQELVFAFLNERQVTINKEQATKIKEFGRNGELTIAVLELILNDNKVRERKVVIKSKTIKDYFPEEVSETEIEELIISLLDEWKNKQ